MTRVKVQAFETLGADGEVWIRNTTSPNGGAYGTVGGGTGGGGIAMSAGTVAITSGTAVFSNANGVSFGAVGQTVTASHNGLTSQSAQAFSASGGSSAFQTLNFGNANGLTFSNNAGTVQASYTVPSTAGLLSAVRLSAGTSSANLSAMTFADSNGVSFGLNGSVVTATHNGLTSQSAQAYSAANGSATFQTLSFANSNGVSFSTGTAGLVASHNGLTSQSNQAFSASGGSSAFQTLSFGNANGVTFSNVGGAVQASYTVPSTAGLLSAVNVSAGTTSQNLSALTFSNLNGVSFGLNGSVVTASVSPGGGGLTNINVSAGTTSQNLSAITFSNGSGVSFGLNGSVITASVNAGGAGASVSCWPAQPYPWATSSAYSGSSASTGGSTQSTVSIYLSPFALPTAVAFNQVRAILSAGATAAGTGSMTVQEMYGLYTRNASTLSLVTSFAWNAVVSQNSTSAQTLSWWAGGFNSSSVAGATSRISGNVSASMTGLHAIDLAYTSSSQSLAAGQYYIGHVHIDRSSSVAVRPMGTVWRYSVSQFTAGFGFSNTTGPMYCDFNGIASTTTNGSLLNQFAMPSSISLGAVSATGGTTRNQWPLLAFATVTA